MAIEVDIDEWGQLLDADVRKPLGGNPVASTRFLRLRFELER
jgi:hypothetical protein